MDNNGKEDIYLDINEKELNANYQVLSNRNDQNVYEQLQTKNEKGKEEYPRVTTCDRNEEKNSRGKPNRLFRIIAVVCIITLSVIVAFVLGFIVAKLGYGNTSETSVQYLCTTPSGSIDDTTSHLGTISTSPLETTASLTTSSTTESTTTTTTTTSTTTTEPSSASDCTSRKDIIIITDEWNVPHTYSLMRDIVTKLQSENRDIRIGLITHTRRGDNRQRNITLGTLQNFLDESSTFPNQFCCAHVPTLFNQASEMFGLNPSRRNTERVILFVSLYNSLYASTIEEIGQAARNAVRTNVDRIVSAGFILYSAENTREEVFAVTTNANDIYSFSFDKNNQTLTANQLVENSLC